MIRWPSTTRDGVMLAGKLPEAERDFSSARAVHGELVPTPGDSKILSNLAGLYTPMGEVRRRCALRAKALANVQKNPGREQSPKPWSTGPGRSTSRAGATTTPRPAGGAHRHCKPLEPGHPTTFVVLHNLSDVTGDKRLRQGRGVRRKCPATSEANPGRHQLHAMLCSYRPVVYETQQAGQAEDACPRRGDFPEVGRCDARFRRADSGLADLRDQRKPVTRNRYPVG